MPARIINTDRLREFKLELLEEIRELLLKQSTGNLRRYLRSSEVRAHLQISAGTLQNMRINGILPYTKIGGTIYYDTEDIQRIMRAYKVDNSY